MVIADALKVWTPPRLAKRYGVSVDKVIRWILAGELAAMNLATTTTGRPRYKITQESVEAFEARRTVLSPPPRSRRKKPSLPADFVRNFR
jgi:helix-turn-helix protein